MKTQKGIREHFYILYIYQPYLYDIILLSSCHFCQKLPFIVQEVSLNHFLAGKQFLHFLTVTNTQSIYCVQDPQTYPF